MSPSKEEPVILKVGELTSRDEFGRGIVRLDTKTMKKLGIKEGDVVELSAQKKTGAIAVRAYPADVGLNIIRMDGITRRNAGVGVGETIKVKKADVREAKRVVVAPAQKGIILQMNPDLLKKNLFMRPVYKKDIITPFPVVKQRREETPFDDFFRSFGINIEGLGDFSFTPIPGETKLMIVNTNPEGIVRITDTTELELRSEAVEAEEKVIPTLTYEDIGGLHNAIQKIREMVELPLRHPELFTKLGIEPPKGVLLYGPPGSGKTLLAKAVANESGASFFSIAGPEIMTKWYGGSEENIRKIFEEAEKSAPSIIFIDEIDSIAPKREEVTGEVERRVVSQLLTLMDGLKSRGKVIVIAATNRQDALDPALRRPGRFDREIEIGVPDQKGRLEILQIHTRNMPLTKDVNLKHIASITYGFVGADLEALAKEAAMSSLRRNLPGISWKKTTELPPGVLDKLMVEKKDFDNALKIVEPSAMREVLIEVPNVRWSDVGGLEEVKQVLKETVEWPLKNPQVFRNVGIKPPSGIMLYGPPGSGKTMLAKALANEAGANFISIAGPELLSKWVGESLPFDEKVMVIENDIVDFKNIGDIVDNEIKKLHAPTITDKFSSKNTKVTDLIRHPAPPYVDVIKTETGRTVRVTGGHSLFVNEDGMFREVLADAIVPGKTRIAIPRYIKPPETIESINLIEYLQENDYNLCIANGQNLVKKAAKKIGIKRIAEIMKIEEKNVYAYIKRAAIEVKKFIKIMKEARIKFKTEELYIKSKQTKKMPAKIKFDKNFSTFLGLWVADGSYNYDHSVRLSVSAEEAKYAINMCKKLFGHITIYKKTGNSVDITIGSKVLYILMNKILGMKHGSKNKNVPKILFSLHKKSIAAFLGGYFGGDGTFSKKYIEASTVSKDLADSIMYLLLYFGIVARYSEKKERNGTVSHRIRFVWQDFIKTFLDEIGFCYESKNKKAKEYIKKLWIKRDALKPKIDKDVYWDLVVDKFREKYNKPYVYDIGINPTHRFIAGFGGILVHNSEKRVREIFRRAKQVAPAIIFFDEIDALAPKRGMYSGTHVTENVVSQILTAMSGLEDMHDVVVIAATNRPDMIDPALLRPGRFDRQILVPAPDEKARLDILKIHTKNMPLKDVDLKKLAKNTEGYTGADLEALVREAGLNALRKNIKSKIVTKREFSEALKKVKPSVNAKVIDYYNKTAEEMRTPDTGRSKKEEMTYVG